MKIAAYVLGGLLVLILCVVGFIFSSYGNSLLASYAQNFAEQKAGIRLDFQKFNLNFSSIYAQATINGEILAEISGELSLFTQKMYLSYKISANSLKSANLTLKNPLNFSGKINGAFADFTADGAGKALGSNANFNARIKDYRPLAFALNLKSAQVSDALALLGKPPYADGLIDATADVKERNGAAEILLYDSLANAEAIKRDFNVTLPANFALKGAINAKINGDKISAKTVFITPVATAKTSKTTYDLGANALNAKFTLTASEPKNFKKLLGYELSSPVNLRGELGAKDGEILKFSAEGDALSGRIKANFSGEALSLNVQNGALQDAF